MVVGMPDAKKGREGLMARRSGPLSRQSAPLAVGGLERALLKRFPAEDAEAWDRTGLLVGDPAQIVRGVAVALDPTVEAVRAASAAGANVLATHHPAFLAPPDSFKPGASVAADPGALVWAAIEAGVALMCYHTALDVSAEAQRVLPGMLNLQLKGVIAPLQGSRRKGYGQLCAARPGDGPLTLGQLAARCTAVFGRAPRVWGDLKRPLGRMATCTGAMGEVGAACLREGVDCLVCGEAKYHDALALSQAGLCLVELGHDASEIPLAAVLAAAVEGAGVPKEAVTVLDQSGNWTYPEATRV